jgi:hypothetical protein
VWQTLTQTAERKELEFVTEVLSLRKEVTVAKPPRLFFDFASGDIGLAPAAPWQAKYFIVIK